jgi:outer membrane protein assembly factor BamB
VSVFAITLNYKSNRAQFSSLQKHPLSVREIVANAPFAYGDGNIYLGSKTSHLYAIDPTTGEVFNCHTSPTTTTKFDCVGEKLPPGVIFIGRADYTIHAVDEQTGQERWNITVGEYVSSSSANKVPSSTRLTSNFTSNGPNTSGTDVHHAYVAGLDGTLQLVDQTSGDLKWTASLQSPVMHIQRDSIEFDAQMPSVFLREQILMLLGRYVKSYQKLFTFLVFSAPSLILDDVH